MRFVSLSLLAILVSVSLANANVPPDAPMITEPVTVGLIVNPSDVHMETAPFVDADPGDSHFCTDWEIWSINPLERVWFGSCVTGPEKVHAHLGDGVFQGALTGESQLDYETQYEMRVRFRDDSGDSPTEWSPYSTRAFQTGTQTQIFPLELDDILDTPMPTWRDTDGLTIDLPAGTQLRVEQKSGSAVLVITGEDGMPDTLNNSGPLSAHEASRVRISSSAPTLALPATNLQFVTDEGELETVYIPPVGLVGASEVVFWISAGGSTFVGNAAQSEPDFSTLARSAPVSWNASLPGFQIDVVASGFQMPVNIAFVPTPSADPNAPLYYVTELYGTIKVVTNAGDVSDYATSLLNFSPTGAFPGSGEQGVSGLAIDPVTGDLFAGMLYDAGGPHYPKVVRFSSNDGGLTATTQTTILDMAGESQGQSHFISNMTIGPDGLLYVHMGDGFDVSTGQNLNSFRGKVLRLNLDGTANSDNPFYDAGNGISARDYVYAYGLRNPFGGAWRSSDGRHYMVENGPSRDRMSQLVEGRNYLWNGSDQSMENFAIHVWNPATAPVNIAFIQPETFGGSGYPASMYDMGFVTESGPTWASGPQARGKRITMWQYDGSGNVVAGPTNFIEYNGTGKATAVALAAGPDGLYFSDFYKDLDYNSPIERGANILRVKFVGTADFTADVTEGQAPLTVQFTDTSSVNGATAWAWDFGDGNTSDQQNPQHTYTSNGGYTVQLQVTSPSGISTIRKPAFIVVGNRIPIALIGGAGSASASDNAIAQFLNGLGYDVTYYDDEPGNRPNAATLAAEQDLVIISSTVTSSNIAGEFRNQPVPVIHWESALNSTARVPLASSGLVVTESQINILDNNHPITAGLALGTIDAFTTPSLMSIARAPLGTDAALLATRGGDTNDYAIIAADTGDELLGGYIAPDKRVYLYLEDASWLNATSATQQILQQAVAWTAGTVLGAPTIQIIDPLEGQAVVGDSVTVAWEKSGDLSAVNHVHVQLDSEPIVMAHGQATTLTIENVAPGPHTITVNLVDINHQPLLNVEATDIVNFTQQAAVEPTDSIAIDLPFNWNGALHLGEGSDADDADSYRSISDRGFYMGQADSPGGGAYAIVNNGMTYAFASDAGPPLDMIMLGARRPGGGTNGWDDVDDDDEFGILPNWDLGGIAANTEAIATISPSIALNESFDLGVLYHASNGGASFDAKLGFEDATSITVRLEAADWFADFDPPVPAPNAGVATQTTLPGPLSGGDGFLAAGGYDAPFVDGPLNLMEARVTAASLLDDLGFDVAGRRLNSITFNNPVAGFGSVIAIYATSVNTAVCAAPGDVNDDGDANLADIARFVELQLDATGATESETCAADLNDDAAIDGRDIALFVDILIAP